ncbi:MAG TPA: hypothetical protein VI566_07005 [Xanthomonadales bacterium]|nr:hypothetical protein [Xanthomonadales bacterium]
MTTRADATTKFSRLLAGALFSAYFATAGAVETQIHYPSDGQHRIDLCLHWGMECAGEAADVYCKSLGFDRVTRWEPDPDVGAESPTVVIGTGQICDEAHCDSFASVTCVREDDWTKSTGNGGLLVVLVRTDTTESPLGALAIAVRETDVSQTVACVLDKNWSCLLHANPGKYRLYIENYNNASQLSPHPGVPVEVYPGPDGTYWEFSTN